MKAFTTKRDYKAYSELAGAMHDVVETSTVRGIYYIEYQRYRPAGGSRRMIGVEESKTVVRVCMRFNCSGMRIRLGCVRVRRGYCVESPRAGRNVDPGDMHMRMILVLKLAVRALSTLDDNGRLSRAFEVLEPETNMGVRTRKPSHEVTVTA